MITTPAFTPTPGLDPVLAAAAYAGVSTGWWIAIGVVVGLVVLGKVRDRTEQRAASKATATAGFASVAGCKEAVEDLAEVVELLRDPSRFERLGAVAPKGALLVGPPGTGKTLLARAVAAEAGVPFLSASATDFVEMYVGVGAKRVRELYAKAREHGRAIVFIDEIDAIARARSMNDRENGTPGGPIEHENTLIALLTELDGFDASNVVTIAATNRADVLDKALTRPGRLERRIEVPLPDRTGRAEILAVHTANKPLAADVDLDAVAARTAGCSGAELARVCNEAALDAARRDRSSVDAAAFDAAVALVQLGRPRTSRTLTDADRKITAWHEAGHTVCGLLQPAAPNPVSVSIVPRGPAAGVTWFDTDDRVFVTKEAAFAQLVVALGGRAAEEVLMGGSCTQGAAGDLSGATSLATKMVSVYGMAGSLVSRTPSMIGGPDEYTTDAVDGLLHAAHETATSMVRAHVAAVEAVADALLAHGTIDVGQIDQIRAATIGDATWLAPHHATPPSGVPVDRSTPQHTAVPAPADKISTQARTTRRDKASPAAQPGVYVGGRITARVRSVGTRCVGALRKFRRQRA